MSSIKFITQADRIIPMKLDDSFTKDKLLPKIYNVNFHQTSGFYLTIEKNRFILPKKVYGVADDRLERVIRAFETRDVSTGVLLTGKKGSGKTFLSQSVANTLLDKGFPVLLIDSPYKGDSFFSFLNDIGECVIIFDEFAKNYSRDGNSEQSQESLLGLFDGVKSQRRLIFVIENNKYKIAKHFINRPGRLLYHFEYGKLEKSVILDYCSDQNLEKKIIDDILSLYYTSSEFSFDILKSIVDEYKRYPSPIPDIADVLNIDFEKISIGLIVNKFFVNGEECPVWEKEVGKIVSNKENDGIYDFCVSYEDPYLPKDKDSYLPKDKDSYSERPQHISTCHFDEDDLVYEDENIIKFENGIFQVDCKKVEKLFSSSRYFVR